MPNATSSRMRIATAFLLCISIRATIPTAHAATLEVALATNPGQELSLESGSNSDSACISRTSTEIEDSHPGLEIAGSLIEDHVAQMSIIADSDTLVADDALAAFLMAGTVYVCCTNCNICQVDGVVGICCENCSDSSAGATCSGWKIVIQKPQTGTSGPPCPSGKYAYTGKQMSGAPAIACLSVASL